MHAQAGKPLKTSMVYLNFVRQTGFSLQCLYPLPSPHPTSLSNILLLWGEYGSGGKSCCLAVRGLPVRSHPGRVKVSLSKTPNPQLLLTSWLVLHGSQLLLVCEWDEMRGINCTVLWIKVHYINAVHLPFYCLTQEQVITETQKP